MRKILYFPAVVGWIKIFRGCSSQRTGGVGQIIEIEIRGKTELSNKERTRYIQRKRERERQKKRESEKKREKKERKRGRKREKERKRQKERKREREGNGGNCGSENEREERSELACVTFRDRHYELHQDRKDEENSSRRINIPGWSRSPEGIPRRDTRPTSLPFRRFPPRYPSILIHTYLPRHVCIRDIPVQIDLAMTLTIFGFVHLIYCRASQKNTVHKFQIF